MKLGLPTLLPILGVVGALTVPALAQTTWYVDDDTCPAVGTGTQADPFCSLQVAVDAASDGDLVLVLPGVYGGGLDFHGRDVEVRSVEGPIATAIVGGVRFQTGEGPGAVLDGFDVNNGDPGIRCVNASPTIRSNRIRDNSVTSSGGGLQITNDSSPLVLGNVIERNESLPGSGNGGGAYVDSSSPRFENNVIRYNRVFGDPGGEGAGMFVLDSTVTLVGNLIHGNDAVDFYVNRGGGIYAESSTLTLVGNTFYGNRALTGFDPPPFGQPGVGGALCLRGCVATILDQISWNDVAEDGPEIAQFLVTGAVTVRHSIVEGGIGAVFQPAGVSFLAGNLDVDPLFVDPAGGDFHLQLGSPAIDAGSPLLEPHGTDGDLDPRVLDGDGDGVQRVDMGWDEATPTTLALSGTPAVGGNFQLATAAPAGQVYGLAFALGRSDLALPPYGSLLIDPTSLFLVGSGLVPGTDSVAVPPDPTLVGVQAFFQAHARALPRAPGAFSRRLELTIR